MFETPYRSSPFDSRPGAGLSRAGLEIAERPFVGRMLLRGPANDARFNAVVGECLDLSPLPRPLKSSSAGETSVLGLGPDEWTVICRPDVPRILVPKLRDGLKGVHAAAVDVSCAFATLRITGPRAVDLLRKGCSAPVDRLAAGDCVQTRVGRHNVLIQYVASGLTLHLHVARSYARAFQGWLADAAEEWSAPVR